MDREAWHAAFHRVAKGQTPLATQQEQYSKKLKVFMKSKTYEQSTCWSGILNFFNIFYIVVQMIKEWDTYKIYFLLAP